MKPTHLDIWNHAATMPSAIVLGAIVGFVFFAAGASEQAAVVISVAASVVAYWGLLE